MLYRERSVLPPSNYHWSVSVFLEARKARKFLMYFDCLDSCGYCDCSSASFVLISQVCVLLLQGGSNMTGTDLYVNKPHCAAAVRP